MRGVLNLVFRWIFVLLLACAAAIVPLAIEDWTPARVLFACAWAAFCIAAMLVLCDLKRFGWATRIVTAVLFVACTSYLIYEWFFTDHPFVLFQSRGESSPRNALLAFISVGLPSLWYTVFGRVPFSSREAQR